MAEFVRHPTSGELRLRHDGTARLLNRSIAWRAIEAAKLAETPDCERCSAPATEAHAKDGVCTVNPPYRVDDLESVCRQCHDATLCTAPRVTALDMRLRWE